MTEDDVAAALAVVDEVLNDITGDTSTDSGFQCLMLAVRALRAAVDRERQERLALERSLGTAGTLQRKQVELELQSGAVGARRYSTAPTVQPAGETQVQATLHGRFINVLTGQVESTEENSPDV